jgi:hypothetical protein
MRRARTLAGTLVLALGASLLFGGVIYGFVRAAEELGWSLPRSSPSVELPTFERLAGTYTYSRGPDRRDVVTLSPDGRYTSAKLARNAEGWSADGGGRSDSGAWKVGAGHLDLVSDSGSAARAQLVDQGEWTILVLSGDTYWPELDFDHFHRLVDY